MQYLCRKLTTDKSSFKLVNQVLVRHFYSTNKCFDAGQPTPTTHPQLLSEGEITPEISCDEYISRAKRLLELLPEQSVAIVASDPVKMMTDAIPYTFRQDVDYLYITGCQQPGGIAVLGHDFGLCMFMPEPSPGVLLLKRGGSVIKDGKVGDGSNVKCFEAATEVEYIFDVYDPFSSYL